MPRWKIHDASSVPTGPQAFTQKGSAMTGYTHAGQTGGAEPSSSLAITALVLAILSWICFGPLTGLPALIIGIIALVRAGETPPRAGGKGMAIAAVVVSSLGIVVSIVTIPLMIGIMLPALGKARESAQRLQSSENVRTIVQGIISQSAANNGQFPQSADGWQQSLIDGGYADQADFVSPYTDGLGDDYFFVPGGRNDFDSSRIVVYEDPALNPAWTLIGFADGHVDLLAQQEAMRLLSNLKRPDGTPYAPHLSDPSATASAPGGRQP